MGRKLNHLEAVAAAHQSWANTEDRSARTAKARKAFEEKFLTEAGGDPQRAASLRKAHFARLVVASVKARRRPTPAEVEKLRSEQAANEYKAIKALVGAAAHLSPAQRDALAHLLVGGVK
jgi:hypothetical protein